MCRKWIYLTCLLVLLGQPQAGVTNAADGSLVGWWKFDETSGIVAYDSSGYGNDGILYGDPQWTGRGLEFDGDGDYVDCGDGPSLNIAGSVTVMGWIRLDGPADDRKIAGNQDGLTGGYKFGVYGNRVEFEIRTADNVAVLNRSVAGGVVLEPGMYHHVAGVYSEGDYIRTYVDGVVDRELSTAELLGTSTGTFKLGREPFSDSYFWLGLMDDVRVYNRALTEGEIRTVVRGEANPFASDPDPADGSMHPDTWVVLSWTPGDFAVEHDVYFGTDYEAVANADTTDPTGIYRGRTAEGSYAPEVLLDWDQTYYWRIDEIQPDGTVVRGDVWSFTALADARTCGTMEEHKKLLLTDPNYVLNRQEIDDFTKWYVEDLKATAEGMRAGIVRIPVVVHVVYNTSAEKISDAQIKSQIKILNEDFRKLNSDASKVPKEFKSVAADTRIEFALAVRDPKCNTTTGITTTKTSVTLFTKANKNDVKTKAKGHEPWPRDKYLNIWVCNFELLGYGTFPGTAADIDGVVVGYDCFGNTGAAAGNYALGRTATHEIGHWLNLYHTFRNGEDALGNELLGCGGTTSSTCATKGDEICDTPPTKQKNYKCPDPKQNSCTETPNDQKDQTMNYMDYVYDKCMYMFTAGQAARMDAALHGPRSAILGSDGLIPILPGTPQKDLWMQDTPKDTGEEPNPIPDAVCFSDDIWVRHKQGTASHEHQNPIYRPTTDPPNYVYVRVRNRGCNAVETGTLKLYWAKASTALSWPKPWDGSVTTPALMGKKIGEKSVSVAAGGFDILEFSWYPPKPADYASFKADKSHFCLLARIETSATSPYGMTHKEGSNLGKNVRNNNNIVWKNVTVAEKATGGAKIGSTTVGNMSPEPTGSKFVFEAPAEIPERSIFNWGTIFIDLGPDVFNKWISTGAMGDGIQIVGGNTVNILKHGAWIGDVGFSPNELYTIEVQFVPFEPIPAENNIFYFDVFQYETDGGADELLGGQRFIIKAVYREPVIEECFIVDDFESYTEFEPNRIFDSWKDGSESATNGSIVGNPEAPFVELNVVHGGAQSMPYFYDNSAGYSEATMKLSSPRDWTMGDVGVLSLWFHGDPANSPEPTYVAVADHTGTLAVVYHEDPTATQAIAWTEWRMDLQAFAEQGVDLTAVDSIAIGFGTKFGVGGKGKIYFDDIRLCPAE